MVSRVLSFALLIISVVSLLIDQLPSKYCIEISYGHSLKKLYVRHEVTFWNETIMEYQQYNWRWFIPFWRNKRGLKAVTMHYNPCYDAPQPFVLDRDFCGFYFTQKQFAAMTHNATTNELNMTINGVPRLLSPCKGPWDKNMRKVKSDVTDAEVGADMSD
ncbi:hypothetical protein FOZ63_001543 [Perkinsus olseni]|uniref:Uncharacterized protein n=1 Tax=Perkinsus olseni TaxID=32597 RepID=A0A7J6TBK0_PEROL|nr:hypothetical protein FOZ63_001543 [Perkinsus olseni]